MWLGQAPDVPYREKRCHYEFRWWYEYSGGKFTDWGAHHVDIATWALGCDGPQSGPTQVDGADAKHPVPFAHGYPSADDCYNTSHDFAVRCVYPGDVEMIVTSRGDNGILFEGTKGRLFVNRARITGRPVEENWDAGHYEAADRERLFHDKPAEEHKANFFRCLREGGLPVSDAFTHTQALATCHLCAIAARLGRTIHWDPLTERIVGDDEAAGFFARASRREFEIVPSR
jgi:predicted dehydrogenase